MKWCVCFPNHHVQQEICKQWKGDLRTPCLASVEQYMETRKITSDSFRKCVLPKQSPFKSMNTSAALGALLLYILYQLSFKKRFMTLRAKASCRTRSHIRIGVKLIWNGSEMLFQWAGTGHALICNNLFMKYYDRQLHFSHSATAS